MSPTYTLKPKKPCQNCGLLFKDHVELKCPFESTNFKPHPKEIVYISAGGKSE